MRNFLFLLSAPLISAFFYAENGKDWSDYAGYMTPIVTVLSLITRSILAEESMGRLKSQKRIKDLENMRQEFVEEWGNRDASDESPHKTFPKLLTEATAKLQDLPLRIRDGNFDKDLSTLIGGAMNDFKVDSSELEKLVNLRTMAEKAKGKNKNLEDAGKRFVERLGETMNTGDVLRNLSGDGGAYEESFYNVATKMYTSDGPGDEDYYEQEF